MPRDTAPAPQVERRELPIAGRECEVRNVTRALDSGDSDEDRQLSFDIVFSAGAAVRRYDWFRERFYQEVLVVDERAVNMERLKRGISLLDTHDSWRLASVLGICDQGRIEGGKAVCRATMSRRPEVQGYVRDVEDGVIRHISTGYTRDRVRMEAPAKEGGDWTYFVERWTPHENSFVGIPADMDSQVVRSGGAQRPEGADEAAQLRTFPCEFYESASQAPTRAAITEPPSHQEQAMPQANDDGTRNDGATQQQQQTPQPAADAMAAAERQRSADIAALCDKHGLQARAAEFIRDNKSVDEVRALILDDIAKRSDAQGNGARNVSVRTVSDEGVQMRAGIAEAIEHRLNPRAQLTDSGRRFRGMTLREIGREFLEAHGVDTRGLVPMDLAQRMLHFRSGMHSTSDFADLLQNVANKRLRSGYEQAMSTYSRWARRAPNAPDFKSMSVVQLSGAPELLQVNEHGEFKYGALTDGKETYSLVTYGRIVALTRQAIVNDDLRGFDRLVTAFGDSASRLENSTVYAILTANANLADGGALFNDTAVTTAGGHANLTGTGTAISVDSLGVGRTAMRKQVGMASEKLNIAPRYLIVPAAKEQLAYQYTSANYVPATPGNVNEFRAGGRTALEPVVDAVLDAASATAWYLAADPSQVDTVEYCYLDGAEGPVIESEVGFEVDGVSWKCRLDFAAKAIDFRGLYKNNGA